MEKDREHFIKCVNCGGDIDMRDLSQVFHHEGDCTNGTPVKDVQFSSSQKVGDPVLYKKQGPFLKNANDTEIYLN